MNKLFRLTTALLVIFFFANASSCSEGTQAESRKKAEEETTQQEDDKQPENVASSVSNTAPVAQASQSEQMGKTWDEVKDAAMKSGKVRITTSMGDVIVELNDKTPLHKENFIKLAYEGFYNELLFHRVIQGFMVQGGDPESRGAEPGKRLGGGGPGYTIANEIQSGLVHVKGALAAARRGGPSNPDKRSSGCQFYIVQGKPTARAQFAPMQEKKNANRKEVERVTYTEEQMKAIETEGGTPFLDGDYTVFGMVVEGLDIVDKIAATPTAPGDRPVKDVTMSMEVVGLK